MREPLWWTIVSNQDQETWLFLADDRRRKRTIRTKMRQMPTACADDTPTDTEALHNIIYIPLHEMVHGYSRTTNILRTSSTEVPSGVNRLLYQVDRSRGIPQDHLRHGDELHLEKRHMSARFTLRNSNRPQFISKKFKEFCNKWKIKIKAASPRYPKCNGHVKAANKTIMNNLKKRLDLKKERWSEELHGVL